MNDLSASHTFHTQEEVTQLLLILAGIPVFAVGFAIVAALIERRWFPHRVTSWDPDRWANGYR